MNSINGIILLNKAYGISSNKALQRTKHLIGEKKAGHTGSLDPLATGMLPLCFGEATKVSKFLLNARKKYRVVATFGSFTSTGDKEGDVVGTSEVFPLNKQEWEKILKQFEGEIEQIPPMYSALKKNGVRLYKYAREGKVVERDCRLIRIFSIVLNKVTQDSIDITVECSKGTYIRVLIEDIARAAGMEGHTSYLHRLQIGSLKEKMMISFDELKDIYQSDRNSFLRYILPVDSVLIDFPEINLTLDQVKKFLNGQSLKVSETNRTLYRVYNLEKKFIGIGKIHKNKLLAPQRIFHLT
ncbi:MAG: tRNA pseudouridine(55) synthase TruB [Pseudomonadota bacterium]|nr:tRNA pseudouridine(55) synthase TruB [Pseudomonadota bacterium]